MRIPNLDSKSPHRRGKFGGPRAAQDRSSCSDWNSCQSTGASSVDHHSASAFPPPTSRKRRDRVAIPQKGYKQAMCKRFGTSDGSRFGAADWTCMATVTRIWPTFPKYSKTGSARSSRLMWPVWPNAGVLGGVFATHCADDSWSPEHYAGQRRHRKR